MDSFEQVIAAILERRGYWTRTSVKVELTAEEKRAIKRPSSPRWELDVVGYSGERHEILVLECKSYLDSPGVRARAFVDSKPLDQSRLKLFFEPMLLDLVRAALVRQLVGQGFCAADPKVKLGLAAGKVSGDVTELSASFEERGWTLWTPAFIRSQLLLLGDSPYENSIAAVVAKMILRGNGADVVSDA